MVNKIGIVMTKI